MAESMAKSVGSDGGMAGQNRPCPTAELPGSNGNRFTVVGPDPKVTGNMFVAGEKHVLGGEPGNYAFRPGGLRGAITVPPPPN